MYLQVNIINFMNQMDLLDVLICMEIFMKDISNLIFACMDGSLPIQVLKTKYILAGTKIIKDMEIGCKLMEKRSKYKFLDGIRMINALKR